MADATVDVPMEDAAAEVRTARAFEKKKISKN